MSGDLKEANKPASVCLAEKVFQREERAAQRPCLGERRGRRATGGAAGDAVTAMMVLTRTGAPGKGVRWSESG